MDYFSEYVIPFGGLKIGIHQYEFEINDTFFDAFDYSDLAKGNVKVTLSLERQARMLVLNFNIRGTVKVTCDRCLDEYDQEIDGNRRLIVKFGDDYKEETEEILIIPEQESHLDIGHYMYEFISLLLPIKRVHPDDDEGNSTCDPVILEKLREHSAENQIDPRWEKLKNLNFDN
ncbi:MAG: DUF177 domain-containing protein [Bacteroidales bacterium]|nr:DUF177 domain-containing protein [Bacteroidales bacterium]